MREARPGGRIAAAQTGASGVRRPRRGYEFGRAETLGDVAGDEGSTFRSERRGPKLPGDKINRTPDRRNRRNSGCRTCGKTLAEWGEVSCPTCHRGGPVTGTIEP